MTAPRSAPRKTTAPRVPVGLGDHGKRLWRDVVGAYTLRVDELEVLRAACGEADLIAALEREMKGKPMTTSGSMGQTVAHPLLGEIRQHRSTIAALLRGLKLPDEPGEGTGEKNQHRGAAQSRWSTPYTQPQAG